MAEVVLSTQENADEQVVADAPAQTPSVETTQAPINDSVSKADYDKIVSELEIAKKQRDEANKMIMSMGSKQPEPETLKDQLNDLLN